MGTVLSRGAFLKRQSRYSARMNLVRVLKWVRHVFRAAGPFRPESGYSGTGAAPGRMSQGIATPPKVAFMHIPKTAGTAIAGRLVQVLCRRRGYKRHFELLVGENDASGRPKDRNFSTQEMIRIAQDPSPRQFFRNHTPWSEEVFHELKRNGWFVFSFVRHPGDLACSWYHFMRFGRGIWADKTLEDCLKFWFIQPLGWMIPDYWRQIDYVREFSEANARDLLENRLGLVYRRLPLTNLSTNQGYERYCRKGEISKETQRLVESHEQFRRYLAIKELG